MPVQPKIFPSDFRIIQAAGGPSGSDFPLFNVANSSLTMSRLVAFWHHTSGNIEHSETMRLMTPFARK
jgi:hypothetical protein